MVLERKERRLVTVRDELVLLPTESGWYLGLRPLPCSFIYFSAVPILAETKFGPRDCE